MRTFRVIAPSPITLNLINGTTVSATKGMIVEPVQDHLFQHALKQRHLVRHQPPRVAPAPAPAQALKAAHVQPEQVLTAPHEPEAPALLQDPEPSPQEEEETVVKEADEQIDETPVEPLTVHDLGLTTRQAQALEAAGYKLAVQVAAASDQELIAVNGIGEKTVEALRVTLASHGI
jgi:hypothetical protein